MILLYSILLADIVLLIGSIVTWAFEFNPEHEVLKTAVLLLFIFTLITIAFYVVLNK